MGPSALVVRVNEARCNGCRKCLPACHAGALAWVVAERELFVDEWACTGCGDCVRVCPDTALLLLPWTAR